MAAFKAILLIVAASTVTSITVVKAQSTDLSPIAGIWALDKADCGTQTNGYDERLRIEANGKNGSTESACSASSVRTAGSRLTFRNSCLSEGERFASTVSVDMASPDRITWKDGNQPTVTYVRCGGSKNVGPKGTATASFEAGSFNLSSHGYSATITSLTGPDTPNATMTGRVTRADAEEECQRNSTNGDGLKPKALERCVSATISTERSKEYVAKANCSSRTIIPHFGGTFTVAAVSDIGTARILDRQKQDIGSATASGAPTIQEQFEKLCPVAFKRLRKL
ncbi:hypothetical protein [Methylorubrum extorquens]